MNQLQKLVVVKGSGSDGWLLVSEVIYRHWLHESISHIPHDCRWFCAWQVTGKQIWVHASCVVQVMPGLVKNQANTDTTRLVAVFDGSRMIAVNRHNLQAIHEEESL